jgi:hypothetical protein
MYDIDNDEKVEKTSRKIVDNLNAMAYKGKGKSKDYLKDGKSAVSVNLGDGGSQVGKNLAAYIEGTTNKVKSAAKKVKVDVD